MKELLEAANDVDPESASAIKGLYEPAIDRGAHPNEMALSQNIELEMIGGKGRMEILFLTPGTHHSSLPALATLAASGAEAACLMAAAWPEVAAAAGLPAEIQTERKKLRSSFESISKL